MSRVVARRGYYAPRAEELNAPAVVPVAAEVMDALTNLVEPKIGRTAEVWVGFTRGNEALTDVTVTWDPTTRTGSSAATRLDVEQMQSDGTVAGAAQSIDSTRLAQRRPRRPALRSTPERLTFG